MDPTNRDISGLHCITTLFQVMAPTHYLNQFWLIVILFVRENFIQENVYEKFVCKMLAFFQATEVN